MEKISVSDELRRYLALITHWGWLLGLVTGLSMVIVLTLSLKTTPVYQASTRVLINEAPATKSQDYTSVLTSERLAQTYAQLLITQPVLTGVIDRLGLELSAQELRRKLRVEPVRDTQLITIRAEDTDPSRAAQILNTLVDVFIQTNIDLQGKRFEASEKSLKEQLDNINASIEQINEQLQGLGNGVDDEATRSRLEASLTQYRELYASLLLSLEQVHLAEAQSTSTLAQVERAVAPMQPIRPRTVRNVLLAGVLGGLLGIGIISIIEAFDDTLKGADDVVEHLGLPVLAVIARYDKDIKLIAQEHPRSPVTEAFRSLRTNLQFASVDYPVRTILVTSPSPEDGKTTVATNLGVVLAQAGRKVTLVDADLRRANIHKVLGVSNRRGISSLFVQAKVSLDGSLQSANIPNLWLLSAGEAPPNPAELLGSAKMMEIIGKVKEHMDIVIIDSPPVMAVTDSVVLASRVDGVLLVMKPGSTNLGAAKQTVEQLRRVGANIVGVVLNELDIARSRYRYYRYKGYYYSYDYYYEQDKNCNGRERRVKAFEKTSNGIRGQGEDKEKINMVTEIEGE